MSSRWTRGLWIGAIVAVVVAAPLVVSHAVTDRPALERKALRTRSMDNLHSLALRYVGGRSPATASGRRFVLSLAPSLAAEDPRDLDLFFSPADGSRSLARAGGARAFAGLTPARLADPAADLDRFTSYVGPAKSPQPTASPDGPALFADLSFGDVALVAFADGTVKTLSKADLGLSESDPLVAGPTSPSPLLRTLSD